ncbi:Aldehyde/histidinol dehydrogenase [Bisporella sp. PMI_857]|nr:Aldehyde/histidinol dehydrogenase [Bisporella sp. PMI_857]
MVEADLPWANSSDNSDTVSLFVNGLPVATQSVFSVVNPNTGTEIWKASSATVEDAAKSVSAAKAAFPSWSKTKPAVRRDIFLKAASIMEARKEELASYMKDETGAGPEFIEFNISAAVSQLKDLAGRISGIQGFFPTVDEDGRSGLVLREPYGVILGIAPWNAPYILGCRAFSYALAAGNTAVLKGSELSPKCFHALVEIFHEAGLPVGCLNLLFTKPRDAADVTTALISNPAIAKINFTGSTSVGTIIAATAGKYLKPVLMELGGKSTAIVLKDADIKKAALGCTLGSFLNSGQVCMGTERIMVHSSIADDFVKTLKSTIDAVFPPSMPAPTLISTSSLQRVQKLVSDAVRKGASTLHGTADFKSLGRDSSFRPTVLSKVNSNMDLHYTESFGPVVSLYTFDTEEEALALANDTEYGLAGAVFTENLAAGLRIAKKYETGAVHINSMSIHDEASLPHGGMKKSGFGRFNGSQGLDEFLRTKVITWED